MKNTVMEISVQKTDEAVFPFAVPSVPANPRVVPLIRDAEIATLVDKPTSAFPRRANRTFPVFQPREVMD